MKVHVAFHVANEVEEGNGNGRKNQYANHSSLPSRQNLFNL